MVVSNYQTFFLFQNSIQIFDCKIEKTLPYLLFTALCQNLNAVHCKSTTLLLKIQTGFCKIHMMLINCITILLHIDKTTTIPNHIFYFRNIFKNFLHVSKKNFFSSFFYEGEGPYIHNMWIMYMYFISCHGYVIELRRIFSIWKKH